jgi:hypothetical protein
VGERERGEEAGVEEFGVEEIVHRHVAVLGDDEGDDLAQGGVEMALQVVHYNYTLNQMESEAE